MMMSMKQITFLVPPSLQDDFRSALERTGEKQSVVLRRLMRQYVRANAPCKEVPMEVPISPAREREFKRACEKAGVFPRQQAVALFEAAFCAWLESVAEDREQAVEQPTVSKATGKR